MAELLIHKVGRGDPEDQTTYQPGDVITIKEDGHRWGSLEIGPESEGLFCVVAVPGPVAAYVPLLEDAPNMRRRRRIDLDALAAFLLADGFAYQLPDVSLLRNATVRKG